MRLPRSLHFDFQLARAHSFVRRSYAWENSFAQRLFDVRNNKELRMLKKMGESELEPMRASRRLVTTKASRFVPRFARGDVRN